ncbi:ABC transporter permease [Mycetocola spongiae]|uniref:ABC transporter permease n=1 Tax=Mycetocola spongiae TaxID=2859226 RepID=UPI001CF5B8A2|nr:ABC transporter permease [Mycetocola spongiae]UCR89460.1 ABC transporter permease [Mycetocola spongiae]
MSAPELTLAAAPARRPRPRVPRLGLYLASGWLILLALATIAALLGAGADPLANDYAALNQAPSLAHPFGTDSLGRDILSRSLHGAGASGFVALMTVILGGGIGILLGVLAGLMRGVVEAAVGFLTDVTIALPSLIIVSTVVTLAGPSILTIALIISAFTIPVFARLARAATLSIATENHVLVARTLGASRWRILTREVLPGVIPMMMPVLMTTIAGAIVAEGALSFLGFGVRPPEPSWGALIAQGRAELTTAPWLTLFPALMICSTILCVNVLGEHFREASR